MFGGCHPVTLATITKLAKQLALNVRWEAGEQRLVILLVRDNVAMLAARTPTFTPQEVDGDLERDESEGA